MESAGGAVVGVERGRPRGSSRCREIAALAGVSGCPPDRAYGESYSCCLDAEPRVTGDSCSDLVERARLRLPDDELEWELLAL